MADPNQISNMVQDPAFAQLSLADQRQALSAHDPTFGSLNDSDLQQFVSAHRSLSPKRQPAPLAASPTAVISNRPNQPIRNWLEDAENDLKYGTGSTFAGRAYRAIGGQPLTNNVPPMVSDVMGGALTGPLEVGHGIANAKDHPVKAFNEVVGGVGKTLALPLAATQPEFLAVATPGALIQHGATKGLENLGVDPENAEASVNATGLALGATGAMRRVPTAKTVSTNQLEAANALRPPSQVGENFPSTEAVLPEIRQAAAKDLASQPAPDIITRAINKVRGQGPQLAPFNGREGSQRFINYVQQAIDNHESQVNAVKSPYLGESVDTTPAANAARSYITPEMRSAVSLNPTGPEARALAQIEDIAQQNEGQRTIADADSRRHRYNDELNSEYNKSAGAADVSPVVTQAKRAAADALRTSFYDRLSDLSGQDIRPLAQREGQLIEAKNDFTASRNAASNSPKNATTRGERLMSAIGNAVNLDRPLRTATSGIPDIVRAAVGDMPVSVAKFNKLANRAMSNLGTPEEEAPPFNPPSPRQTFDYEGARPGEPEIVREGNFANATNGREVPLANKGGVMRRRQLLLSGDVPRPSGSAAPEFTYPAATRGDVLAKRSGMRVPPQISAVLPKGLLPERGSATALPAESDTSVVGGRNVEVPRTNAIPEGAIPQIVRQFVESHPFKVEGKVPTQGSSPNPLPKEITDLLVPAAARINVVHPSGQVGTIPAEQLSQALAQGFRLQAPLVAT